MNRVEGAQLKELLIKNWMTHDAMWFYHSVQSFGMEKTNVVNRAAVRSMAGVEIKRLRKALASSGSRPLGSSGSFIAPSWRSFSVIHEILLLVSGHNRCTGSGRAVLPTTA